MLTALEEIEAALPDLLADEAGWQSLYIDYHPPFVERLYRPWGPDLRVNLHRIWPCSPQESLFHPHPWPSAVRILSGQYRMRVGYGSGVESPPTASTVLLVPGASYEMTHPDAWHAVQPVGGPSLSLMVTGRPWGRAAPISPRHPLGELSAERRAALLRDFRTCYPPT